MRTNTTLPRVQIECPTMAAAEAIREQYPDCLVEEDDSRSKTVVVSGDALDRWILEMQHIAREDDVKRFGQKPLTRHERQRLDFTRTNVFHARSCKAIARVQGVDDWLARYDPELTVDEHRDVYARTAARGVTLREFSHRQFHSNGGVRA